MSKKTFLSKTFWGGIASIITGVGFILSGDVQGGVTPIIMGVLAILGRDAISKME